MEPFLFKAFYSFCFSVTFPINRLHSIDFYQPITTSSYRIIIFEICNTMLLVISSFHMSIRQNLSCSMRKTQKRQKERTKLNIISSSWTTYLTNLLLSDYLFLHILFQNRHRTGSTITSKQKHRRTGNRKQFFGESRCIDHHPHQNTLFIKSFAALNSCCAPSPLILLSSRLSLVSVCIEISW